jgi:cell wall assembly regulator SMI1
MKTTWDRIHFWLAANAPEVLASLRPGASDEQIRHTEQTLGVTFPKHVHATFQIHDGQREWTASFIEGFVWLSLEGVVDLWRFLKGRLEAGDYADTPRSPVHYIGDTWWNTAWVPLTEDGNGYHHFLDLSPPNDGRILRWDVWGWTVVAPSFCDWLEAFADDLERGVYLVEDYGLALP